MGYTYTKLFSGLTESTVWVEPYATRVLWVSMLSWADQHGRVFGSLPGIARRAGITLDECEAAILSFMSPDRHSRTPDHDGRRIEKIEGGWRLLNYEKYRDMRDDEVRREQNRLAQQRWRDRQKQAESVSQNVSNVSRNKQSKQESAQAEADTEADIKEKDEVIASSPRKRGSQQAIGEGSCIATIPGIGGEVAVCESAVKEWQDTYRDCDVPATLKEIRAWVLANPNKRKVNVHRFIVNWLKRENDRG